ncbi:MAG: hypothetical protein L0312_21985 [Acidobacteria bacterium]|nr:hypothetical protein [Acidobacteriota bacterium]
MDFFSLQNKGLVIFLGLLLLVSWAFGIYQYGVANRWEALDFARSSAYEYNAPDCLRWFSTGQANLSSFTKQACESGDVSAWSPQCRDTFRTFQENMENWVFNCSFDLELRLR